MNLIILLDHHQRWEEAQGLTETAIEKYPNNPEFLFQYGNILGQTGEYHQSEQSYLTALKMKQSAKYWNNLGVLYQRWNRLNRAVSAYQAALKIDETFESARTHLNRLQILSYDDTQ